MRRIYVELSDEEIKRRLVDWKPKPLKFRWGYLERYSSLVKSADEGATFKRAS